MANVGILQGAELTAYHFLIKRCHLGLHCISWPFSGFSGWNRPEAILPCVYDAFVNRGSVVGGVFAIHHPPSHIGSLGIAIRMHYRRGAVQDCPVACDMLPSFMNLWRWFSSANRRISAKASGCVCSSASSRMIDA